MNIITLCCSPLSQCNAKPEKRYIHDWIWKTRYNKTFITQTLQHGLEVFSDVEWRLGLALDLIHSNAVCDLDEGEAVGEVDIEDTLGSKVRQDM